MNIGIIMKADLVVASHECLALVALALSILCYTLKEDTYLY